MSRSIRSDDHSVQWVDSVRYTIALITDATGITNSLLLSEYCTVTAKKYVLSTSMHILLSCGCGFVLPIKV